MAENIGGSDLFASGGHRWVWEPLHVPAKVVGAVGLQGDARTRLRIASRAGRIVGTLRAASDAALTTLEAAIEALAAAGEDVAAEDDAGRTMTHLVVESYRPTGLRQYAANGTIVQVDYVVQVRNLLGRFE
ncbi:MAG: hypothetical protein GX591_20535 [Planctomycetes bacterium]|nr:hypothetical protein [Planctomycetota bacterium]